MDSPAFPTWDVSCPARAESVAREIVRALGDSVLVKAAELGAGTWVHMRWRDDVLIDVARGLVREAATLPPLPAVTAWRRGLQFGVMARREHSCLERASPRLDGVRDLASRLEWFGSAGRAEARRRLAGEAAAMVDALYARPLLRQSAEAVAGTALVLAAASAAFQIGAS